ncbi:Macrophage migration inhibitory factor [Amphibalanus amphitrite]|uniref:L-dopachrome isomerase n=1 Tax=Amphibalanus amphitrite TaxID=1232801 RepID=A0A6A4W1A6_AMPAM|nr:macrophage migration inhibitory factor homolog [Amphibalanus amphitrite]KAF0295571.1 Macrophage migration inhibitory factor [Amphibalanus amphitrite]
MPVLEIDTNVPQEKITPEVVQNLTKLLSEMLGLGLEWFPVVFRPNPLMMWGGTSEPCAVCRLTSVNNIDEEANRKHTEKLFNFMKEHLGIPGNRMYILYTSPSADDVGHKGVLISDLRKAK